jgi:hypothetical protein
MLEKTERGWIPSCEICNWVGEPKPEQGQAQVEYMQHCKTKEHKMKKVEIPPPSSEEKETPSEEGETFEGEKKTPSIAELTPQEAVLYYGEDEVINYYRRKKLKEFLETAPQVSARQAEWILMNYESDERAKSDPNSLYNLLIQSRLEPQFAYRIVQNLVDMEQKLRLKISGQQAPAFPPMTPMATPYMPMPTYPPQFPPQFLTPWQQPQFSSWQPQFWQPLNPFYFWQQQPQLPWVQNLERIEKEIKELKEERKTKVEVKDVGDERYMKIEKELEKMKEDREREERERKEKEREERWQREINELKEAIKSRSGSEVMTITVPLRDSSGNIITGPDGKPVQQMFQGPPSYIQAILAQKEPITPERIQLLVEQAVSKANKPKEGLTKEELQRILDEREEKKAWKEIREELKEVRREMEKGRPMAGVSEGTTVELKKLDLIGDKLEDMHDTIKTFGQAVLQAKEKPRERTPEDITKLDEELSVLAKEVS